MDNNSNYESAFNELKTIVEEIERGNVNLDELSDKVSRAAHLIDICKAKLLSTEENVNQIIEKLNKSDED